MYRKPKFLEVLHEIRKRMAREVDYDIDLFTQQLRVGAVKPEPGVESFPMIADVKRPPKAAKKAKKER